MSTDQDTQAITLAGRPDELAQVVLLLAQQLAEQQVRRPVQARNLRVLRVPTATSPLNPVKRRVVITAAATWTTSSTGVAVWAFATASLPTAGQLVALAAVIGGIVFLLVTALSSGSNKILVWGERVG